VTDLNDGREINRLKFLARLSAGIGKCGIIDVLRKGAEHGPVHFDIFYGTPSPGNTTQGHPLFDLNQLERIGKVHSKQRELKKCEIKLRQRKRCNRKVESTPGCAT
jgi:type I restriction enzyme R subunit